MPVYLPAFKSFHALYLKAVLKNRDLAADAVQTFRGYRQPVAFLESQTGNVGKTAFSVAEAGKHGKYGNKVGYIRTVDVKRLAAARGIAFAYILNYFVTLKRIFIQPVYLQLLAECVRHAEERRLRVVALNAPRKRLQLTVSLYKISAFRLRYVAPEITQNAESDINIRL